MVWSAHLMSLTTHVGGDHRVEAEGEHVVLVRGEGKPRWGQFITEYDYYFGHSLPRLVYVLPADEVMPSCVGHHQVNLLACYFVHLELSCHQDIFVDLLLQTFPKKEEDTARKQFDRNPLLSIGL